MTPTCARKFQKPCKFLLRQFLTHSGDRACIKLTEFFVCRERIACVYPQNNQSQDHLEKVVLIPSQMERKLEELERKEVKKAREREEELEVHRHPAFPTGHDSDSIAEGKEE